MSAFSRRLFLAALGCLLAACSQSDLAEPPKPLFELTVERDVIRPLQIARVVAEPSSRSQRRRAPDAKEWVHIETLEALSALKVKAVRVARAMDSHGYTLQIDLDDGERERLRRYSSGSIGERSALMVDGEILVVLAVRGVMTEASFLASGFDASDDVLAMARRFAADN